LRALAWLFRIAHNVVVNHYRARRQFVPLDDDISTDDSSLDRVEHAADGQLLATLISELPDDQRNLLSLVVDAGLTSQQIGDLIGKNAGAVRVQLHRILKSLRERFLGECVQ
jgi:RNA polymerase sigma-70 factor (ECF subfamily)